VNDLEQRIASLSSSLSAAWARIERLERASRPVAPLASGSRCSTQEAAGYACTSRRAIERLLKAGKLGGVDVRKPGARRARWVVDVESLRAFLRERELRTTQGLEGRDSFT
jgi:hypothetical protein